MKGNPGATCMMSLPLAMSDDVYMFLFGNFDENVFTAKGPNVSILSKLAPWLPGGLRGAAPLAGSRPRSPRQGPPPFMEIVSALMEHSEASNTKSLKRSSSFKKLLKLPIWASACTTRGRITRQTVLLPCPRTDKPLERHRHRHRHRGAKGRRHQPISDAFRTPTIYDGNGTANIRSRDLCRAVAVLRPYHTSDRSPPLPTNGQAAGAAPAPAPAPWCEGEKASANQRRFPNSHYLRRQRHGKHSIERSLPCRCRLKAVSHVRPFSSPAHERTSRWSGTGTGTGTVVRRGEGISQSATLSELPLSTTATARQTFDREIFATVLLPCPRTDKPLERHRHRHRHRGAKGRRHQPISDAFRTPTIYDGNGTANIRSRDLCRAVAVLRPYHTSDRSPPLPTNGQAAGAAPAPAPAPWCEGEKASANQRRFPNSHYLRRQRHGKHSIERSLPCRCRLKAVSHVRPFSSPAHERTSRWSGTGTGTGTVVRRGEGISQSATLSELPLSTTATARQTFDREIFATVLLPCPRTDKPLERHRHRHRHRGAKGRRHQPISDAFRTPTIYDGNGTANIRSRDLCRAVAVLRPYHTSDRSPPLPTNGQAAGAAPAPAPAPWCEGEKASANQRRFPNSHYLRRQRHGKHSIERSLPCRCRLKAVSHVRPFSSPAHERTSRWSGTGTGTGTVVRRGEGISQSATLSELPLSTTATARQTFDREIFATVLLPCPRTDKPLERHRHRHRHRGAKGRRHQPISDAFRTPTIYDGNGTANIRSRDLCRAVAVLRPYHTSDRSPPLPTNGQAAGAAPAPAPAPWCEGEKASANQRRFPNSHYLRRQRHGKHSIERSLPCRCRLKAVSHVRPFSSPAHERTSRWSGTGTGTGTVVRRGEGISQSATLSELPLSTTATARQTFDREIFATVLLPCPRTDKPLERHRHRHRHRGAKGRRHQPISDAFRTPTIYDGNGTANIRSRDLCRAVAVLRPYHTSDRSPPLPTNGQAAGAAPAPAPAPWCEGEKASANQRRFPNSHYLRRQRHGKHSIERSLPCRCRLKAVSHVRPFSSPAHERTSRWSGTGTGTGTVVRRGEGISQSATLSELPLSTTATARQTFDREIFATVLLPCPRTDKPLERHRHRHRHRGAKGRRHQPISDAFRTPTIYDGNGTANIRSRDLCRAVAVLRPYHTSDRSPPLPTNGQAAGAAPAPAPAPWGEGEKASANQRRFPNPHYLRRQRHCKHSIERSLPCRCRQQKLEQMSRRISPPWKVTPSAGHGSHGVAGVVGSWFSSNIRAFGLSRATKPT
ncbi:unnamed protein product [Nesidiocoris tenuis]|uniref:Uncharacterized protein n=1 Tax=Nesidiocoris tenuis TaxID=355587 RepID=A0A6H5HDR8_9HEMI|nr:unnamed protein product [Nesidiocoris tenuis]